MGVLKLLVILSFFCLAPRYLSDYSIWQRLHPVDQCFLLKEGKKGPVEKGKERSVSFFGLMFRHNERFLKSLVLPFVLTTHLYYRRQERGFFLLNVVMVHQWCVLCVKKEKLEAFRVEMKFLGSSFLWNHLFLPQERITNPGWMFDF